jgi:hypothetical protein
MLSVRLASPQMPSGELAGDYRWFPEDFRSTRQQLSFVFTSRAALASQPFLDHRWPQDGLEHRQVSFEAIADELPHAAKPELNFIWHTSFCCSTLLAHALDAPGRNLSLSEPMVLVSIADAKKTGAVEQGWQLSRLPEIVFRLLARPETPGARVLVKPSNFANHLLPDAARLTSGKSLFLYSGLPDFLVSIAKSGISLRKYARKLFASLTANMREQLPWPAAEIFQMSDLEIAALVWHLQLLEFRSALPLLGATRSASLNCDAFLTDPETALAKLDAFFGLGLGARHIAQTVSGPLLNHHAKAPSQSFDADCRRKQADDVKRHLGDDLNRIVEWSYRACPMTPQGVPLPNALL